MITVRDTEDTLRHLAALRPIFHSEADFQHALAWSVHRADPSTTVRLEIPFRTDTSSEYLDLQFTSGHRVLAVELKYKTRRLSIQHAGEDFALKQQGAQDLARYDFLADVARLERFVAEGRATVGWAILLTNDPTYWSGPVRAGTIDEQFRLNEGRVLEGALGWRAHASEGTVHGRSGPICLQGRYSANWRPYSNPSPLPGGEFRFLAWEISGRLGGRG